MLRPSQPNVIHPSIYLPNPNPNPNPIPNPIPNPTPNQACQDDAEAEATLFWRNRQPVLLRLLARAPGQF